MDGSLIVYDKEKEDAAFTPEDETLSNAGSEAGDATNGSPPGISMLIHKSVHSKNQKMNPVAAWKLSNQRIHAFSFSPDNRHLAVVSEDGTLRLIDYLKEESVAWDTLFQTKYNTNINASGFSISSFLTMAASPAWPGHQMANMY